MGTRLAVLVVAATLASGNPAVARGTSNPDSSANLEHQKLQQEVRQLTIENRNATGIRGFLRDEGGLLAGLAAIAGVLVTLGSQRQEQSRQRNADRTEREKDAEQRRLDSQRRVEARFAELIADIGAEREPVQAAAAVSLLSFLSPEHSAFHRQIRLVTLANLKIEHTPAIRRLVLGAFEGAMATSEPFESGERDLSGADLSGARLKGLDMSNARLDEVNLRGATLTNTRFVGASGVGAILEDADLSGAGASLFNARLPSAWGTRAVFDGAELVNAHLERSMLAGARFRGARMQAAHLENANLSGAKFEGANVADTRFTNASFDDAALRTLLRTVNLEKAHFSPDAEERLQALAKNDL